MLHKEKSNNRNKWKLAIITPFLLIFLMAFNTETVAQSKIKEKVVEINSDVLALILSKKATKADLEKIKSEFAEIGLKLTFSGIKRNSNNEITAIKVDAKATNGKASAAYAADSNTPIKSIKISFDNENNHLSLGSLHGDSNEFYFSTGADEKIVIRKSKSGTTEDVIHIETNEDEDTGTSVNIWKSKNGKGKMSKRKEVIVEVDDNGNETKKEIIKIRGNKGDRDIFIFEDDDENDPDTKITYIVNGKKMTKDEFKKMDKSKIETIEIKKEVKKKKKN